MKISRIVLLSVNNLYWSFPNKHVKDKDISQKTEIQNQVIIHKSSSLCVCVFKDRIFSQVSQTWM